MHTNSNTLEYGMITDVIFLNLMARMINLMREIVKKINPKTRRIPIGMKKNVNDHALLSSDVMKQLLTGGGGGVKLAKIMKRKRIRLQCCSRNESHLPSRSRDDDCEERKSPSDQTIDYHPDPFPKRFTACKPRRKENLEIKQN